VTNVWLHEAQEASNRADREQRKKEGKKVDNIIPYRIVHTPLDHL